MAFALCYILYSALAKENGKQVAARWIYASSQPNFLFTSSKAFTGN
jgi:hypothetical protein